MKSQGRYGQKTIAKRTLKQSVQEELLFAGKETPYEFWVRGAKELLDELQYLSGEQEMQECLNDISEHLLKAEDELLRQG